MIFIAVLTGYVVTSCFFLRYPSFLHKRKKLKFEAKHISHRGGAAENTENTLAAFQHAVDVGTHMLELDCHITLDKQVVVSHDNNLKRATGTDVLVSQTLYKNLPPLKETLCPDFQRDHVVVSKGDRTIPLLRDVFERFRDIPINIDIKVDDNDLIDQVSQLVEEFERSHVTVWGNRNHVIQQKCFKKNPQIGLFFSMRRVVMFVLWYYSGLLPFMPITEDCYEIFMPNVMLREGVLNAQLSTGYKLFLKVADWLLMSKSAFRHLKERGIQVYVWVLNSEEDFERAFELGATGVMTDFPTKLTQFLDKKENHASTS